MKLTKATTDLICELEHIIGSQCYNPVHKVPAPLCTKVFLSKSKDNWRQNKHMVPAPLCILRLLL